MKLIEKYTQNELSVFESFLVKAIVILNKKIRSKIKEYKLISQEMKYMFLIKHAEYEIIHDDYLRNLDFSEEYYDILKKEKNLYVHLYE